MVRLRERAADGPAVHACRCSYRYRYRYRMLYSSLQSLVVGAGVAERLRVRRGLRAGQI